EKLVEVEKIVEVPVEVIKEIERVVEVPVEKFIEVEKLVEVEKIVEVEKVLKKPLFSKQIKKIVEDKPKMKEKAEVKTIKSKQAKKKDSSTPGRRKVSNVSQPEKPSIKREDLSNIEGIGPKISKLLNKAGIYNYEQLGKTNLKKIQTILAAAGPKFQMHDPSTWPEQAKLLAKGKLNEFQILVKKLKGGRKKI
ncbi:MAG: hypothetical protein IT267_02010, partial [Saprospiraceae bacterium]|nr:hypothetical protein [Saprospiraceae bacterium]